MYVMFLVMFMYSFIFDVSFEEGGWVGEDACILSMVWNC